MQDCEVIANLVLHIIPPLPDHHRAGCLYENAPVIEPVGGLLFNSASSCNPRQRQKDADGITLSLQVLCEAWQPSRIYLPWTGNTL